MKFKFDPRAGRMVGSRTQILQRHEIERLGGVIPDNRHISPGTAYIPEKDVMQVKAAARRDGVEVTRLNDYDKDIGGGLYRFEKTTTFESRKNMKPKNIVKEEFDTEDGWDCDEIRDSGLLDTLRKCANLHYTLDKCTRASANFGETLGDLKAYVNELAEEMQNAVANFPDEDEEVDYPPEAMGDDEEIEVMERIGDTVSDADVRELVLYITNDSGLYHRYVEPIIANLRKKVKKGIYNPELAVKLWKVLADEGAKKYDKELNDGRGRVDWLNVPTRLAIAKELRDHYQEQVNDVGDDEKCVRCGDPLGDDYHDTKDGPVCDYCFEGVEVTEAIPRSLKEIDPAKAEKLIAKHTKDGSGEWEGSPEYSDFVYQTPDGRYFMLRRGFGNKWEHGKVSM